MLYLVDVPYFSLHRPPLSKDYPFVSPSNTNMAKKKAALEDPPTLSLGEMSDSKMVARQSTKKKTTNGVKSAPKATFTKTSFTLPGKKSSKKQPSKNDVSCKKKQKRKDDKDGTSPPAAKKKRKNKSDTGSARSSYAGTDDDSSEDEDGDYSQTKECLRLPEIGDEIAIKCPPDPPYPEGWYTGVVIDAIVHDEDGFGASNSKAGPKSKKVKVKNFTLHIEWDGGGEEALINPEWRMKGDAPDKHGRVSHRDAKLRPYFKYWVNRLTSMSESEKKLSRSRAGKNTRVDPDQKIEWIQCSNPNCGKWRPLPPYMKSSEILKSCNNKWYCVLTTWDEAVASCGAPQETGYMPLK